MWRYLYWIIEIQNERLLFRLLQLVAMFMSIWWTAAGFIHLIGENLFNFLFFMLLSCINFIWKGTSFKKCFCLLLNNFQKIFLRRKLRWSPGFHKQSEPLLLRVKTPFLCLKIQYFNGRLWYLDSKILILKERGKTKK